MSALAIFDATVKALVDARIMVVLNNHQAPPCLCAFSLSLYHCDSVGDVTSTTARIWWTDVFLHKAWQGKAMWCCSEDDGEGLWYSQDSQMASHY